jgi:hypothetical protein
MTSCSGYTLVTLTFVEMLDDWHGLDNGAFPVPATGQILARAANGLTTVLAAEHVRQNRRMFSKWRPLPA